MVREAICALPRPETLHVVPRHTLDERIGGYHGVETVALVRTPRAAGLHVPCRMRSRRASRAAGGLSGTRQEQWAVDEGGGAVSPGRRARAAAISDPLPGGPVGRTGREHAQGRGAPAQSPGTQAECWASPCAAGRRVAPAGPPSGGPTSVVGRAAV